MVIKFSLHFRSRIRRRHRPNVLLGQLHRGLDVPHRVLRVASRLHEAVRRHSGHHHSQTERHPDHRHFRSGCNSGSGSRWNGLDHASTDRPFGPTGIQFSNIASS
jgi:hypothetical protein